MSTFDNTNASSKQRKRRRGKKKNKNQTQKTHAKQQHISKPELKDNDDDSWNSDDSSTTDHELHFKLFKAKQWPNFKDMTNVLHPTKKQSIYQVPNEFLRGGMILIDFEKTIHLDSVKITAIDSIDDKSSSPPKTVKFFKSTVLSNIVSVNWDDDKALVGSVDCDPLKLKSGQMITFQNNKYSKFGQIRFLKIVIESNQDNRSEDRKST
eukprot:190759_1